MARKQLGSTPSSPLDSITKSYVDTAMNPVNRETVNQNTALKTFGDSVTAGTGASGPNFHFPKLIADAKGWTLANVAVAGSTVYDPAVTDLSYAEVVDSSKNYTLMVGINNAGVNGTNMAYFDTFRGCLLAVSAWLTIPDIYKVKAASTTRTGTWVVNSTVYGGLDYRSSTNGSTMTTVVTGTTVYVAHIKSTGDGGLFRVVIDGNDYGIFATNGSVHPRAVGGAAYATYGLRFPGLANGKHTVAITVTSATSASNNVYIDWIGGNGFKKEISGPNLWLGNPTRATDAYYASAAPLSDASISLYCAAVTEVSSSLSADGLSVTLVDSNSALNRSTDMAADGLHPNDAGMAKIADVFIASMSSYVKMRDRGGSQRINTPWFEPSYLNSWVAMDAAGSGYFQPGYMKDAIGFVHLRGIVKSGTIGTAMFHLPVGFRPAATYHQICDTLGTNVKGNVEILVDGSVIATTGSNGFICLDGIVFEAGA